MVKFLIKGCSAALEEIARLQSGSASMDKTDFSNYESDQFRFRAFDTYFSEKANMKLVESGELMHRECALFYKENFLIVASSSLVQDENLPAYDQLATNNESIHYTVVENYTIYLIDLKRNVLCDKIRFPSDKINLTHNQSLSLFRNVFAVLSQQNQTIHVYHLVEHGLNKYRFVLIKQIGRFCFPDDVDLVEASFSSRSTLANLIGKEATNVDQTTTTTTVTRSLTRSRSIEPSISVSSSLQTVPSSQQRLNKRQNRFGTTASSSSAKGFNETCFTGMKHRILTYFYKEAFRTNTLQQFYLNLNNILKLKMYKMQLLDDRYWLILVYIMI